MRGKVVWGIGEYACCFCGYVGGAALTRDGRGARSCASGSSGGGEEGERRKGNEEKGLGFWLGEVNRGLVSNKLKGFLKYINTCQEKKEPSMPQFLWCEQEPVGLNKPNNVMYQYTSKNIYKYLFCVINHVYSKEYRGIPLAPPLHIRKRVVHRSVR